MRNITIGVRANREEIDAISFAARVRGVTVATFLRAEALRVARSMLRVAAEPELPAASSTEATDVSTEAAPATTT